MRGGDASPVLDAGDVTRVLQAHVDPALEAVGLERVSVGNSQETWLVTAARPGGAVEDYVLRRSVPAGVLAWTSREDEHRHLAALAGRGLPVPVSYGTGTPAFAGFGLIGSAFAAPPSTAASATVMMRVMMRFPPR